MLPANRWTLLVNKGVQQELLVRVLRYWAGYHLALCVCLFAGWALQKPAGSAGDGTLLTSHFAEFGWACWPVLACAALATPLLAWLVLLHAHRFLGPGVRFENTLKQMSRGEEVHAVNLRQGDYLQNVAEAFNNYLVHRRAAVAAIAGKIQATTEETHVLSTEELDDVFGSAVLNEESFSVRERSRVQAGYPSSLVHSG